MSIQAVAWALEQDLPARPKLVLVSIANHANHTDGYCWLKAETIAREAACTPRSVFNFVGALVRNGYIRKSLRKGDDGKQRATDYWMLLNREDRPWVYAGDQEAPEAEEEAVESATADDEPQDVVLPDERGASGENALPDERHDSRQPVETPPGACGPVASTFHRKRIAEPSKSNSEASSAGARVRSAALRTYRPPPPLPLGADTEHKANPVFVYESSRAYDAWSAVMAKRSGIRSWHLVTRAYINGQWRSGWYFPSLFPPETGPPKELSHLSACDLSDFK